MRAAVENAINAIVGKSLWACFRAGSMAMFDFGTKRKIIDELGREKEVGDFALHVECAWRITRGDRVIVGSRDLHYPADYREDVNIPPDFDWDHDLNRLDKLIKLFFEEAKELVVESVGVGPAGSLCIVLTGHVFLEVLIDDSLAEEHWRLFRPGKREPHFVMTGKEI